MQFSQYKYKLFSIKKKEKRKEIYIDIYIVLETFSKIMNIISLYQMFIND